MALSVRPVDFILVLLHRRRAFRLLASGTEALFNVQKTLDLGFLLFVLRLKFSALRRALAWSCTYEARLHIADRHLRRRLFRYFRNRFGHGPPSSFQDCPGRGDFFQIPRVLDGVKQTAAQLLIVRLVGLSVDSSCVLPAQGVEPRSSLFGKMKATKGAPLSPTPGDKSIIHQPTNNLIRNGMIRPTIRLVLYALKTLTEHIIVNRLGGQGHFHFRFLHQPHVDQSFADLSALSLQVSKPISGIQQCNVHRRRLLLYSPSTKRGRPTQWDVGMFCFRSQNQIP